VLPHSVTKRNNGLQDSPRAGCPCGEGEDEREKPKIQLHTCLDGEAIEIRDALQSGGGRLSGDHEVRDCGFGDRGFDTRGCSLLWLNSSRLSGCCRFWLGLLTPGRLPGGGHFRLRGRHRDRLRRRFWLRWWGGGGLDNTPLSDDVIPAPRPGPFARQRARPAELSERRSDPWRRSFGHHRSLDLQVPSSPLSI